MWGSAGWLTSNQTPAAQQRNSDAFIKISWAAYLIVLFTMQLLGNLTPLAYWPDTADCCGYIAKVNLSAAERSRGQKKIERC